MKLSTEDLHLKLSRWSNISSLWHPFSWN